MHFRKPFKFFYLWFFSIYDSLGTIQPRHLTDTVYKREKLITINLNYSTCIPFGFWEFANIEFFEIQSLEGEMCNQQFGNKKMMGISKHLTVNTWKIIFRLSLIKEIPISAVFGKYILKGVT